MSAHVGDLPALAVAGALEPGEQQRVNARPGGSAPTAPNSARQWRSLGDGLRDLPAPTPSPAFLRGARTAVERLQAEREERTWNCVALGLPTALGRTLSGVAWLLLEPVVAERASRLHRPLGPTAAWVPVVPDRRKKEEDDDVILLLLGQNLGLGAGMKRFGQGWPLMAGRPSVAFAGLDATGPI